MPHLHEFQQRVVDEKTDLDEKIEKLYAFLQGKIYPELPVPEQKRLKAQVTWMRKYSSVLGERIEAFGR